MTSASGPAQSARRSSSWDESERAVPHPLHQQAGRRRLQPEPAPARLLGEPRGKLARPWRRVAKDLAAGGLDRLGEPLGSPGLGGQLTGDEHEGQIRRQGADRGDHGRCLFRSPALDAVGQQVASRGDQRDGGDRHQHRVDIGRRLGARRPEALERPRAALPLAAGAEPGERRVDLPLVVADDQIDGLDRLRSARIRLGHGSRVYSRPRLSEAASSSPYRRCPRCRWCPSTWCWSSSWW